MKYNNSKNKIKTIWEENRTVEVDLSQKQNEIKQFFTERHQMQKIKNIYDSGWIATTPTAVDAVRNVTPDQELPERVTLDTSLDIEIPEIFLPFINVTVMTKTVPKVSFLGVMPFIIEGFDNDYFSVHGNGTNLIYKGYPNI